MATSNRRRTQRRHALPLHVFCAATYSALARQAAGAVAHPWPPLARRVRGIPRASSHRRLRPLLELHHHDAHVVAALAAARGVGRQAVVAHGGADVGRFQALLQPRAHKVNGLRAHRLMERTRQLLTMWDCIGRGKWGRELFYLWFEADNTKLNEHSRWPCDPAMGLWTECSAELCRSPGKCEPTKQLAHRPADLPA